MPTLETYRKQAKLLLRWHREGNYSIGGRVRQLKRYQSLTDAEVLSHKFTLAMAQEIIATEAGYQTWAELKAASAEALKRPRARAGAGALNAAIPVLLVRDVAASVDFFEKKLGFEIDFLHGKPPFYGEVSRDGARLHLRYVREPFFAQASEQEGSLICVFIEVSNLQDLFKEFEARNVEFAQKPTKQAWGGTDFHVRDPDGNVLCFATTE
ncbi:MAG TPA: VOC family protein [Candidatus Angelobacter sp.]|nr:VOC family protein [Candidatus Angelobacter sp.]